MYKLEENEALSVLLFLLYLLVDRSSQSFFIALLNFRHETQEAALVVSRICKCKMCEYQYGYLHYSGCGHTETRDLWNHVTRCASAAARGEDCKTVVSKVIVERTINSKCFVCVGLQ